MQITDEQKQLMRHTIGSDSSEDRNFFGTNKDSRDAVVFDQLVVGGLATEHKAPAWSGNDVVYRLTDDGIFIANH